MEKFKSALRRIVPEWKYIFSVFIISRTLLEIVGTYARNFHFNHYFHFPMFSSYQWLDIWGIWDTWWYLEIAQYGYSETIRSNLIQDVCCGQNSFGFFPLYPVLIRYLTFFVHDYFVAGVIISNVCLLLSAFVLYKLVLLDFNKVIARNSVLFLFIFPTSFILSGVFSESLFLLFALLSFYFARQSKWSYVGVFGYLAALARPTGFLLIFPLFYLYISKKIFAHRLEISSIKKSILYILSPLLGMFTFMLYTYSKTGSLFTYFQVKHDGWGHQLLNPFFTLFSIILSGNINFIIIAVYILILLAITFLLRKSIPFEYTVFTVLLIIFTLMNGAAAAYGIPRFSSVFFSLSLAFALLSVKYNVWITSFLVLLQVVAMFLWVNGVLII